MTIYGTTHPEFQTHAAHALTNLALMIYPAERGQ